MHVKDTPHPTACQLSEDPPQHKHTHTHRGRELKEGQILMHYVALVILNVNTLGTCRKDINYSIDSLHKNILIATTTTTTTTTSAMMIMEAIMKMLQSLLTVLCGLLFIPSVKGVRNIQKKAPSTPYVVYFHIPFELARF